MTYLGFTGYNRRGTSHRQRRSITTFSRLSAHHDQLLSEILPQARSRYKTVVSTNSRIDAKRRAFEMLQQNNLQRAKELYGEACRADKTDAESRYMLGVVYGRLQQFDAATDRFRQAIAIQPQMAMAHYGLGAALSAQNKLDEAVNSYQHAVRIMPNAPEIHSELANIFRALGKLDEAKHHLQELIRLRPSVETYLTLGNIQSSQGLLSEAIPNYQEALKSSPNRADINNTLGFVFYRLGKLNEAVDYYHLALKHKPDFTVAYDNLGRALMMLGRIDEATSCLQEALRIDPDYVHAAASIVAAYELSGDYQKAGEYLAPLIEKHPDNPSVAMTFLRLGKQLGRSQEALAMAEKVLAQNKLAPLDKKQLHFSSGKLYDAVNAYDKAFAHYQSANATQPPSYDPAKHTCDINALISNFSAATLQRLPRATHSSEQPVFVLGMPRSGTSLVEQILASHPQVHGAGELTDIGRIVARMVAILDPKTGFPGCIHKLTASTANTLAEDYLAVIRSKSADAARVTDKMPHNFLCLGLIAILFPKARVIHCKRNPLDTCLSIYFQYFNDGHTYSHDLAHIGSHYRDYERLMAHWRKVLDIPMLEINYEDIVTNPDEMIRKLVDFVDLEWDPVCLRFYESARLVSTASYDQVRQPLHPKSIGRWKHYAQHLGPLKSALGIQD